jgi:hypothetical protein
LLVPPSPGRAVEAPAVRRFEEDAARSGPVEPWRLGHRSVDVARIVGAIGALGDLGADFRPRRTRDERALFRRTVRAMEREMARELEHEAARPVVALRKLGYGYYVATEPHQVAAARHLQRRRIVAEVTEYVSLHDETARQAFEARRAFEQTTGLTRIGAALPETYAGIESLVRAFGGSQGIPDVREAAMRWEAAVFRPLQVRLRERRLHEWFPGERSADVVFRVARFDLAGGRRSASWDEVLDGFVAAWGRRWPDQEAAA